jgi:hypothetical protein
MLLVLRRSRNEVTLIVVFFQQCNYNYAFKL